MILILHYYKSIVDGVMTSMIDTFFNLKLMEPAKIDFKIICPELYLIDRNDYYNEPLEKTQWYSYINSNGLDVKVYEESSQQSKFYFECRNNEITTAIPFLRYNRNFGDFRLFYNIEQHQREFESDIIICSARLIYEIMSGIDITLRCKKLIVLDSFDTYKSKIGMIPNFDDYFDSLKYTYITQLSNPVNFRETRYEQKEYYHKLSKKRLKSLRHTGTVLDEYTFKRAGKEKTKIENGYFENIGKSLFEHLYLQKKVNYLIDGMYMKDGMCYYLEQIGINSEKNYVDLKIPISQMEKLLFINSDYVHHQDLLLKVSNLR